MTIIEPDVGNIDAESYDATRCQNAETRVAIKSTIRMSGQREVIILHAGKRYRLRVTANDMLIL